ncbi:MAG: hypothetical protein ACYCZV_16740 [Acidimicrobiales bacterium]
MTSTAPARSLLSPTKMTWADDTVVYAGADATFGQSSWDLRSLCSTVNHYSSSHLIDFTVGLPGGWSLLARELCMCRIDLKTTRASGIVLQRRVKASTTAGRVAELRRIADFQASSRRGMPASWTQADADALLRWRAARTASHRELTKVVEVVWDLRLFAPLLSEGGLGFDPWPGLRHDQVLTQVLGADKPAAPQGTLTPVLPLDAFVALFAATRAYVEVFATDILALHRLMNPPPAPPGHEPTAADLARWAEDPYNAVPVHTEASARAPGTTAKWDVSPGAPIWSMITRLVGGTRPRTVRARGAGIVQGLIDAGRTYAGLGRLTAVVERPDGSVGAWRGPFESLSDINHERAMLRTAAYILLVGLTGMRDSEAQDLRRGAVHDYYGTPALATRRHKMRQAEPEPVSWWVCDLALAAYGVLEALSGHPSHVVGAMTGRGRAGFDAGRSMHSFVNHVNATLDSTGLAPIPAVDQLSPQVLRETAAYAMGRFSELGDLVVGHLFGHARTTVTASYQRYRPGDGWNARMREGEIDATAVLLDTMGGLIEGSGPIIGGRAEELGQAALEVRATIVTDPAHARRIAQLHQTSWHHGEVVSCRFDAASALCHRMARQMGMANPEPGPLHDLCVGVGCANAHYSALQLPALRRRRTDAGQALTIVAPGSVAAAQLSSELAEVDQLIVQLEEAP